MSRPCRSALGVVSPHLDDAVLSCGQVLAAHPGSHVVTVFSSGPERVDPLPFWDEMCGCFSPGDDVMGTRRKEDDAAMALARAEGHRLGFWDGQYRTAPPVRMARLRPGAVRRARAKSDPDALADAVRAQLHETITDIAVTTWLIPLGLHPGDHELVARSTLDLARDLPEIDWLVYEELPYRVEDPVKAASALRRLEESAEWSLEQVQLEGDPDLSEKRAMVECHRSQMGALGDRVRLAVEGPEAFHRLRRADVRREP